MNDHAYLYANTSDKSIMYDLAVQRALAEVLPVLGGHCKTVHQPALPPRPLTRVQDFEKWTVSSRAKCLKPFVSHAVAKVWKEGSLH